MSRDPVMLPPPDSELARLVELMCDSAIAPAQRDRLESLLDNDTDAQLYYLAYLDLHAQVQWLMRDTGQVPRGDCPDLRAQTGDRREAVFGGGPKISLPSLADTAVDEMAEEPPILDAEAPATPYSFLSDSPTMVPVFGGPAFGTPLRETFGYVLSTGWPLAYLVATVIFGIGALIGSHVYMSAPEQLARQSVPPSPPGRGAGGEGGESLDSPPPPIVGRITGMVDCQFDRPKPQDPSPKTVVSLGDTFALSSGLLEITYDTGAKVILQGPVTYETESNGGYLSLGKLTGKLEAKTQAPRPRTSDPSSLIPHPSSFVIRTPAITVTDLGTKFGVEVNGWGEADVHVFVGKVDCRRLAAEGSVEKAELLTANTAAHFDYKGSLMSRSAADQSRFARMPKRRSLPLVAFYPLDGQADDASGSGNHVAPSSIRNIAFVDGVEGRAARFDANAGSFIELPVDTRPEVMPKFTWGAWLRPRVVGPARMAILSTDIKGYGRSLTIDDRIAANNEGTGSFRFAVFLGNEGLDRGVFPSSGPLPKPNAWTFVAAAYDDSSHRAILYVEDKTLCDGAGGLIMDRTVGSQFGQCNSLIRVGRHFQSDGEPFDGDIDNVFVFREVLSLKELELIRRGGTTAIMALAKGEAMGAE